MAVCSDRPAHGWGNQRNYSLGAHQIKEVGLAHPHILETVESMVKKGKWTVLGYKKFGDLSLM
jgi:hypothetical protein